jgi:hypothetical protein
MQALHHQRLPKHAFLVLRTGVPAVVCSRLPRARVALTPVSRPIKSWILPLSTGLSLLLRYTTVKTHEIDRALRIQEVKCQIFICSFANHKLEISRKGSTGRGQFRKFLRI